MTTKHATIRKCDTCGKQNIDDHTMIGGSPFQGWLSIHRTNGNTSLSWLYRQHQWDVCGTECLKRLINVIDAGQEMKFNTHECPCGEPTQDDSIRGWGMDLTGVNINE